MRTHENFYFTDDQRYIKYLIHFLHNDLSSLSEFVDSFLKFQAQKRKYYIRGTKDFKLSSTKNIPENSFLVTMDVSSLYTNIHHEEGAEACFKKLEERKNKSVPSIVIKNLVLMIFNSNPFRFSSEYCSQIIGTAMGHK